VFKPGYRTNSTQTSSKLGEPSVRPCLRLPPADLFGLQPQFPRAILPEQPSWLYLPSICELAVVGQIEIHTQGKVDGVFTGEVRQRYFNEEVELDISADIGAC